MVAALLHMFLIGTLCTMYTLIQHISSVRVAGHGCQFKARHACIYFVHKECSIFLLQQTVASETCLLIVQPLCFGRPSLDFIVWRFHGGGSSQTSERSCSLFLSHHSVLSALPNWYRRCLGINKRLWPQWPHTTLQI